MYLFAPSQLGQGFTQCSTIRFGSGRCSSTLELATSTIVVEGMFLALQGFTCSSIVRFGSGRCFCTLGPATSTLEVEGVFLCDSMTRARSRLQFFT